MSFSLPLRRLLGKTSTALPSRGWLRSASSKSGGKYGGGIRQKSGESTAGNKSRRWAPSPVKGDSLSYPTVDLARKVVIITGGNTGLGYETAKALAGMGAHTIIACRSKERATAAIERIKQELVREDPAKQVTLEYMQLDLSSFQSTKDFISAFKGRNLPLDILVNNAGVAWMPLVRTPDGYESQFQINHLGHFLMTLELLPNILETASTSGDGRIVFVSSGAHAWANWEPANMNAEQLYDRQAFYPYSKMYNVMTMYALQRRLRNVGVTVSSVRPGLVATEIMRGVSDVLLYRFAAWISTPFLRTAKEGAATQIYCAVNPELNTQEAIYYNDCAPDESSEVSRNEQFQEELWRISVDIVKDYLSPDILEKYGPSQSIAIADEETKEQADSNVEN